MKWQPKSETELMEEDLMPSQKAPFTVMECQEKTSKSGKPMLALKLGVHADDGMSYHIYDYISPDFMAFKFRHFFYSVGMGQNYEAGTCEAFAVVGREGWCDVGVQKAKGEYGPKNIITDYIVQTEKAVTPPPGPPLGEGDDVPF